MKRSEDIRIASIASGNCQRKEAIKNIPRITLSGNWLMDAGFQMNDKIQVKILPGKLVITQLVRLPGYKRQIKKYMEQLNRTTL